MPRKPAPDDAFPVYRDGLGRIIPNEDQLLREAAQVALRRRFTRRVTCVSHGRSGQVIYDEGDRRIEFWDEIGGGPCKWFIDVPTPEAWEARTGFPQAERDEVLRFVAEQVQRQQCPRWPYRIGRDSIVYYGDEDAAAAADAAQDGPR